MKPRSKNDSWFYYGGSAPIRRRIRRISNKRHRRADKAVIRAELAV